MPTYIYYFTYLYSYLLQSFCCIFIEYCMYCVHTCPLSSVALLFYCLFVWLKVSVSNNQGSMNVFQERLLYTITFIFKQYWVLYLSMMTGFSLRAPVWLFGKSLNTAWVKEVTQNLNVSWSCNYVNMTHSNSTVEPHDGVFSQTIPNTISSTGPLSQETVTPFQVKWEKKHLVIVQLTQVADEV